ncbi:restriction endonuclease subunit S [Shewanella sp. 10N.286.52.A9]|uniref:restriction endonuclease subunit S n=1 Tax=Shewanella sp. 10N.286.52.A9 TaxID=3229711 RepID=UPI00354F28DB
MMPNDWENKTLESLCDPDAPITYGVLKPGDYVVDGIPLLQIKDLLGNINDIDSLHRISSELDHEYRRSRIATNDILISLVGTVGRLGLVPKEIDGSNIHRNLGRIRTNHYEFLIHYLNSDIAKNQIGLSSSGSSQSALNLTVLRALKVPIPPLPEQRKIATILGTWDKAISTTERLIDNSKQQKKALMQQLLTGKKRLLDDSGKSFEGEWEEVAVGDLGTIYSGGTPSTSNKEYWDGDIDWITPTDITKQDSVYINSSVRRISAEGLKNSSAKLVPKGSLLVCTRATIGEMAITAHEMCTNQGFKNIIPNQKTNIEFLFYLLTYEKHKLISKASGSTFLELSKSAFESMKFNVPLIGEQQKIAAVLTNADKEIVALEKQLADLKQEKKALMQQLLTGKRRVKV